MSMTPESLATREIIYQWCKDNAGQKFSLDRLMRDTGLNEAVIILATMPELARDDDFFRTTVIA